MVANAFKDRLALCLRHADVPEREWRKYVHRHFDISTEMVRRYLAGEGVPKGERMRAMAVHFGVSSEWLETGRGEAPAPLGVKQPAASYSPIRPARMLERKHIKWRDLCGGETPTITRSYPMQHQIEGAEHAFWLEIDCDDYKAHGISAGCILLIAPDADIEAGRYYVTKTGATTEIVQLKESGGRRYLELLQVNRTEPLEGHEPDAWLGRILCLIPPVVLM